MDDLRKEIEKLKRHIQLMENGKFIKVEDFEAFCDERENYADGLGYWILSLKWPLDALCSGCNQQFSVTQRGLNGSHVDIAHIGHTGHAKEAYLPVIIGCVSCGIEAVYNLPKLHQISP